MVISQYYDLNCDTGKVMLKLGMGKEIIVDVLDESNRRIGHTISEIDGRTIVLSDLWVNPRKRRGGIGSRMVEGLKQSAKELGATSIKGNIVPGPGSSETEVRRFYEDNGFTVDENGNFSIEF